MLLIAVAVNPSVISRAVTLSLSSVKSPDPTPLASRASILVSWSEREDVCAFVNVYNSLISLYYVVLTVAIAVIAASCVIYPASNAVIEEVCDVTVAESVEIALLRVAVADVKSVYSYVMSESCVSFFVVNSDTLS